MNNGIEYLKTEIPNTWNRDQNSWIHSNATNNSLSSSTTHYIENWLRHKPEKTMENITLDHNSNEINMLRLKLQQTTNNLNQLEIHLLSLTNLDETDEIASKIRTARVGIGLKGTFALKTNLAITRI